MKYREPEGLKRQIEQLRSRWPQAHYEPPTSGNQGEDHLIVIPGMKLPRGWNATICTALFLARPYRDFGTSSPLNGFYVDLPDLRLEKDMAMPEYSRPYATSTPHPQCQEYLSGFRQWRDLRGFGGDRRCTTRTTTRFTRPRCRSDSASIRRGEQRMTLRSQ